MIRLAALLFLTGALDAQTTVRGKVTNILDARPVAGAVIVLQGDADAYMAETDAEGRFRIDDVVPDRYEARPQREGFQLRPPVRLTIAAEAPSAELDLRLTPLGAISGSVVDTEGDTVSKIQVEALRYTYANGTKQLETAGRTRTDDRGAFTIFGLAPGRYFLRASDVFRGSWANNLQVLGPKPPTTYSTVWFPTALDAAAAVSLEVGAGAELRDNEIRLRPQQTYTIRVRVAGGDASGRATLSIGTPNGLAMMIDLRYGFPFAFPYAAPGTYHLEAIDKNAGLEARRTVRMTDSDVDITLTPAAPLSLAGSVRVDGRGPAAATIRLVADDTANNAQAAAKADGTFVIPNVQPTIYTVQVDAGSGTYLKSIRFGEHTLTALQIDLARTSGPLIVTLGSDGGALAGHVAVDDATVVLVRKSPDLTRSTTARDGSFEFRDVAPGDYTVFAWSDGESGPAIPVHIAAKQSATVDLRQ